MELVAVEVLDGL